MAVDVFISYSSLDSEKVIGIAEHMEASGISCWYAPRNIVPGQEWVTAIHDAIHEAKVFLLIYTENSNASRQVHNEVALAFNTKKYLIPFRLSDVPMNGEIEYYMTRVHWLDAANLSDEEGKEAIVGLVRNYLNAETVPQDAAAVLSTGQNGDSSVDATVMSAKTAQGKKKRVLATVFGCIAAILFCIGMMSFYLMHTWSNRPQFIYGQGYEAWRSGDIQKASGYLQKAVNRGYELGTLAIGTMRSDELRASMLAKAENRDFAQEGENLKQIGKGLVNEGFSEGNFLIGFYYAEGFDGTLDKEKAVSSFEQAAQGREMEWRLRSYGYLCLLHSMSGKDSPANLEKVEQYAELISLIFAQYLDRYKDTWPAYGIVCTQMGDAYRNMGEGRKAFLWYECASQVGVAPAMNQLGLAYLRGDGVEEDLELARKWLQRAADAGDENAKSNLEYLNQ